MKMYFTFGDTQPCILNDKIIIAKVVVEWNRKINKISTKMVQVVFHAYKVWITHLNFVVLVD